MRAKEEEKLKELLYGIISDLYQYSPDMKRIMINKLNGIFEMTK